MVKGHDALTEIQFNQPGETVMQMLMYQFKLTNSYQVVMNMCLVWRDGTDFIQTQSQPAYRDGFSI